MTIEIKFNENDAKTIASMVLEAITEIPDKDKGVRLFYTTQQAYDLLGIPKTALKQGILDGRLQPIVQQGSGGTKFHHDDLVEFAKWLNKMVKSGALPVKYLKV